MGERSVGTRVPGPVEPLPPEPPGPIPKPEEKKRLRISPWMAALLSGLALLLAWGAVSLIQAVHDLYMRAPLVGVPILILGIVFCVALIMVFAREYRAFREIGRLEGESKALAESLERDDPMGMLDALSHRLTALRVIEPDLIEEFEKAARKTTHARRVHELFENIVLEELDEKADQIIEQESLQTCLAVAILPHPALDAAVVLWRGCGLVGRVSNLYGIKATGLSSLRLFQHVVESAMLAAAAETLGRMLAEEGVAGVVSPVVKPLGEAAVTYLRIRRLGDFTKRMLLPVAVTRAAQ